MVNDNDPFLEISASVRRKLADKHLVVPAEVWQCFLNHTGNRFLEDSREKNKTNPPTKWFISETDSGRLLKVCFIYFEDVQKIVIKSAFEPNQDELNIFFQEEN